MLLVERGNMPLNFDGVRKSSGAGSSPAGGGRGGSFRVFGSGVSTWGD